MGWSGVVSRKVSIFVGTFVFLNLPVGIQAQEYPIVEALRRGQFSVESFLESELFTESHRKNFLALKSSVSPQPGSLERPRIVSYGDRKDIIISFNGGIPGDRDPAAGVNRSVEIMFRNPDDQAYDFYHITLQPGENPPVVVDGPNPIDCLECHYQRQSYSDPSDKNVMTFDELQKLKQTLKSAPKGSTMSRYKSLYFFR
jgi:hypothetical protein